MTKHTVWTATQELDADYIKTCTGKVLCVLDMISEGDEFLQTPCTIENGVIYIGSIDYKVCDESGVIEGVAIPEIIEVLKSELVLMLTGIVNNSELPDWGDYSRASMLCILCDGNNANTENVEHEPDCAFLIARSMLDSIENNK